MAHIIGASRGRKEILLGLLFYVFLLVQGIAKSYAAIDLPYNHCWQTDHQITCAEHAGQPSDRTNDHHSNIHEISPSLSYVLVFLTVAITLQTVVIDYRIRKFMRKSKKGILNIS